MTAAPASAYVDVPELTRYLSRHPLDCRLNSRELASQLSYELGGIVTLKTLLCAAVLTGVACIPQRRHVMFCRVAD